jgi:hypothetical protein
MGCSACGSLKGCGRSVFPGSPPNNEVATATSCGSWPRASAEVWAGHARNSMVNYDSRNLALWRVYTGRSGGHGSVRGLCKQPNMPRSPRFIANHSTSVTVYESGRPPTPAAIRGAPITAIHPGRFAKTPQAKAFRSPRSAFRRTRISDIPHRPSPRFDFGSCFPLVSAVRLGFRVET